MNISIHSFQHGMQMSSQRLRWHVEMTHPPWVKKKKWSGSGLHTRAMIFEIRIPWVEPNSGLWSGSINMRIHGTTSPVHSFRTARVDWFAEHQNFGFMILFACHRDFCPPAGHLAVELANVFDGIFTSGNPDQKNMYVCHANLKNEYLVSSGSELVGLARISRVSMSGFGGALKQSYDWFHPPKIISD